MLRFWFVSITRAEVPLPLSSLFAPFLSLRDIKTFDISFRRGYVPHVLGDDLRAFAAAWPHLEVLSIWAWRLRAPALSSARPPTFAGLIGLARGSPRLRRVMLPALDISALPKLDALPPVGHKGVRFLNMCALVGDDVVAAEDVAKILDQLFPCREEYLPTGVGTPHAKSWFAVQDAMQALQGARNAIGRQ